MLILQRDGGISSDGDGILFNQAVDVGFIPCKVENKKTSEAAFYQYLRLPPVFPFPDIQFFLSDLLRSEPVALINDSCMVAFNEITLLMPQFRTDTALS